MYIRLLLGFRKNGFQSTSTAVDIHYLLSRRWVGLERQQNIMPLESIDKQDSFRHRQPGGPALDILGDRSDQKTGINQLRIFIAEVSGLAKKILWVSCAFV